jgi:cyclohexyl-isocyanide hydratase
MALTENEGTLSFRPHVARGMVGWSREAAMSDPQPFSKPFIVVFALFPGVTQLDFTGPYEILARLPGAQVIVGSSAGGNLRSEHGLTFADTTRLAEVETCDLICVPGGPGQVDALADRAFLSEVRRLGLTARYVTSVCTGSLILGAAGLITGKRAACHWAYRDLLPSVGAIPVAERVVRDGNVFTGGGVTAGIDFALTVAAEVAGPEVAQMIQLGVEYAPAPPFNAGSPETAPPEILAAMKARSDSVLSARSAALKRAAASL